MEVNPDQLLALERLSCWWTRMCVCVHTCAYTHTYECVMACENLLWGVITMHFVCMVRTMMERRLGVETAV